MEENQKTFTYTARNANDPNKVVTFTISDAHLRINLTGLLDQAAVVLGSEEKAEVAKRQLATQARPAALKLREAISGPVHVSDVNAILNDNRLNIRLWPRVGGLRLAPVNFNMGQIDNPPAAEAFVNELEQRQETETDMRKFLGPLDYWLGWVGLALLLVLFIRKPANKLKDG